LFIGLVSRGGIFYSQVLDRQFNYLSCWNKLLLQPAAYLIHLLGYSPHIHANRLFVEGKGTLVLSYSCLGYGACSVIAALAVTANTRRMTRLIFIIHALLLLHLLNVARLVLLVLYWKNSWPGRYTSHHALFNTIIYALLLLMANWWIRRYYFDSQRR
jgi:exosortase/archaeosortase family protein